MMILNKKRLLTIAIVIFLLPGCSMSPTKQPVFMDPAFDPNKVENITILPILDRRIDKSVGTDINETGKDMIKSMLKGKDYRVNVTNTMGNEDIMSLDLTAIDTADSSWSAHLGPDDSRWVFLTIVTKIERHYSLGVSAEAEVVGYLYDKSTGAKVWKDEGKGEFKIGYFLAALADDGALEQAIIDMLNSFPERQ